MKFVQTFVKYTPSDISGSGEAKDGDDTINTKDDMELRHIGTKMLERARRKESQKHQTCSVRQIRVGMVQTPVVRIQIRTLPRH